MSTRVNLGSLKPHFLDWPKKVLPLFFATKTVFPKVTSIQDVKDWEATVHSCLFPRPGAKTG